MTRELSRWGVGPGIMVSASTYASVAGLATWSWPGVCLVTAVPRMVLLVAGIALLVVGVPVFMVAGMDVT
jgi:hypothetical protein